MEIESKLVYLHKYDHVCECTHCVEYEVVLRKTLTEENKKNFYKQLGIDYESKTRK